VLNDIFRYLVEEEDEIIEEAEAAPAVEAPKEAEPAPAPAVEDAQVTDETAVNKVDEKLEQETNGEAEKPAEATPQTNGTLPEEDEAPVPAVVPEVVQEKPLTPEPSPVAEKQAPVEKEPVAAAPAVPKSWASIASKVGAAAAPAAAPAAPAAAAAAPAAPKAAAPAPQAAPAAAPTAPAAEARPQESAPADGWQTAGSDHKKTQSRAGEQQTTLGYIKNVTDKIDANALKQTLSRFGKVSYLDVSRQKVCIFI